MKLLDYQKNAARTCASLGSEEKDITHMNLGIITEASEVLDVIKKRLAYGKEIDIVNFGEECADIAWYVVNKSRMTKDVVMNIGSTFDSINVVKNVVEVPDAKATLDQKAQFITKMMTTLIGSVVGAQVPKAFYSPVFVMCMLDTLCFVMGIEFSKQLENNIAKLKVRFPDKFDADKALVRNLDAERKELEK